MEGGWKLFGQNFLGRGKISLPHPVVNNIPFLGGAASSIIGAAKVKEVKGLGTDLLRTGRL